MSAICHDFFRRQPGQIFWLSCLELLNVQPVGHLVDSQFRFNSPWKQPAGRKDEVRALKEPSLVLKLPRLGANRPILDSIRALFF
jgi:hypothetical protein